MTASFDAPADQGSRFLDSLAGEIDRRELAQLAQEGGFSPPNEFPVERLAQVLRSRTFPDRDFYEFEWAIYESGFDCLPSYSPELRLFLASLYVYCNKRRQWGISIESDYLYLAAEIALESGSRELGPLFLSFLEWLHDQVPADRGYEDYYLLLTWLLLRRLSGDTEHPAFGSVVERLLEKGYGPEELEELTVGERGIEAWDELHGRIACPERWEGAFEEIIWGMPVSMPAHGG